MKSPSREPARREDASARTILDSIRRIVRALRVSSRAAEQRTGLTGAQLFVLQRLAEREPVSINELAARTLTHQSSVSVVVQRLERRGLVQRARAASDGRSSVVSLTAPGRVVLRRPPDLAQLRLLDSIAHLPAPARRTLARGLERLVSAAGFDSQHPELFFEADNRPKRADR